MRITITFQSFVWIFLLILILGCGKVDLKTKLELTAQTPKWSQLFSEIYDLTQEIQNIQVQIQKNKKEINQKFLSIEDSTHSEKVSIYKTQYFQQLAEFQSIINKSKKLHDKYVKDRTLYNYWLNTVQNDVISQENAIKEQKIFEKKYENLRKEYQNLKKEFLIFIQKSNESSEALSDLIPDLVGIKFRVKSLSS
jgi:hypothetical protein